MSQTISQLPAGTSGTMGDIIPITQGSIGPGTGTTRKLSTAQVLSSSQLYYVSNPAFAGGALANGVQDDTAAWTAAFSAAQATGGIVVAPIGVSLVSGIAIPANVMVIGYNAESYGASAAGEQTYTAGNGSVTLGSVIQSTSGASIIVTMAAYSQIRDIQIVGTGSQTIISATAGRVEIQNVDLSNGSVGVALANNNAGSIVRDSRIHHMSGAGITNPSGCNIYNNTFNSCLSAVTFSAGSNNNMVGENKVAFCSSSSFSLVGTSTTLAPMFNTFVANVCDRSGNNAFALTFAQYAVITGNGCWRSGRANSGTPNGQPGDAHFNLTNCTGVLIASNTTSVWGDDSPLAIGYNSPYYAVFDGAGNINCQIVGNILTWHANSSSSAGSAINVTTTFNLASSLNVAFWSGGRLT
jgi:hypothetical protein